MKGNSGFIVGNATRDAEERTTQSGRTVFSWGLAWNSSRPDGRGGYEEVPHFFDCKCWCSPGQAPHVRGLINKGCKVGMAYRLEQERWEKDGQQRSKVVLVAEDPIGGLVVSQPKGGASVQTATAGIYDEDLPF